MSQDQPIEEQQKYIDLEDNEQQEVISIGSQGSRFSQDFHSDDDNAEIDDKVNPLQSPNQIVAEEIPQVKNPVSPYMMFVKGWKDSHPGEKLNISMMGDIWKELSEAEKEIHHNKYKEEKVKYDEYVAAMMARDPNFAKKNLSNSKKFFFPLHRVKAIMKQDNAFTATTENVSAMARATQYFGEYLLEQIKKNTEGKKRIDIGDFFSTINSNQSNLWFMNCLIDEYNAEAETNKKQAHSQQKNKQKGAEIGEPMAQEKVEKKSERKKGNEGRKKNPPQLGKGQMKLTDMF